MGRFRICNIDPVVVDLIVDLHEVRPPIMAIPTLPLETFFRNPDKSSFTVSPDGTHVAYRADVDGIVNLYVQPIDGTDAVAVSNDRRRSIQVYTWKGDRILYAQDTGGDENHYLCSVACDGTDLKVLTPTDGVKTIIIDMLDGIPGYEGSIMIAMNTRRPEYFDPFVLDCATGVSTPIFDNDDDMEGWLVDNTGTIRMARKAVGTTNAYYHRVDADSPFELLFEAAYTDHFQPVAFHADNCLVYAISNIGRDTMALVSYDPRSRREVEVIHVVDGYDIDGATYDRFRGTLATITWVGERREHLVLDSRWKDRYEQIHRHIEPGTGWLVSTDDRLRYGIVHIASDLHPASYALLDGATGSWRMLANAVPWIDPAAMAPMEPISYTSRDGLTIHGYLTKPLHTDGRPVPVIVNPHGGPWARDVWGFNPVVQFLANRGYAVLQMNFRASTGYGRSFWLAGNKQWGLAMQDDITDGVRWLIDRGIADPARIAIYGGSYGGYATLAGITFTPDLYACAIDYVGISNLFSFLDSIPPYWKPYLEQIYARVGDPVADREQLEATSPLFHANRIKVPVFIAQGANDPRVKQAESDQMVEALRANGVPVDYMIKTDEGHGFVNQDNRFDFYRAMETFLAEHLA